MTVNTETLSSDSTTSCIMQIPLKSLLVKGFACLPFIS